jgi:D-alanine-D-alanine ligase
MVSELRERGLAITDDALEEYDAQETIDAIAAAIRSHGHDVDLLGWGRRMLGALDAHRPHLVFNIAEGVGGRAREAQVPATLEMLGIPFVGSDALALAVSLDKQAAKDLVRAANVAVPKGYLAVNLDHVFKERHFRGLDYPLIVKPNHEGSSKGIFTDSVVWDDASLQARAKKILDLYHQPALVEEYIWGREVTVGIVGDPPRILGVMEVLASSRKDKDEVAWTIYSLEAKRDWKNSVNFSCPADLDARTSDRVRESALAAFRALGCRDVSRVDFRLRTDGTPVFLEINPLPGLSAPPESSDLVLISTAMGISYNDLIGEILGGAIRRLR